MYGSVTWVFSSLSVTTERTPKTTKAVAPSEDDMVTKVASRRQVDLSMIAGVFRCAGALVVWLLVAAA
jgi:hypothetical protein